MFVDTSVEAAREQLEPYHDQLHQIFVNAVRTFNQIPPNLLLPLMRFQRTKANCIWAYAIQELELAFPEGSPVKLKHEHGSVTITFGPNHIGRLKKMSADGFTSNYLTHRVKAFHNASQGELFQFLWSKPIRVDIGYLMNETSTGVERVMVARRKAPRFMDWMYPIFAPNSGAPVPIAKTMPAKDDTAHVEAKRQADADVAQGSDAQ